MPPQNYQPNNAPQNPQPQPVTLQPQQAQQYAIPQAQAQPQAQGLPPQAPGGPFAGYPVVTTPKPEKKKGAISTQKSLLIAEIRDGIVIMKDGSLRAVVMCQSINFDLMSPQEREAVEFSYQGFLNSLYFPIQIFVRSQKVNLDSYIDKLEQLHQAQDNILLGLLTEDYIAYVRYLVEAANIMDKQFYVVVPYYPPLLSQENITKGLGKIFDSIKPKKNETITINEVDFRKYKSELVQSVRMVVNGLLQMGIQAVPLNTQELIELYYTSYNPLTAKTQKLTDINQLEAPLVEKGTPGAGGRA